MKADVNGVGRLISERRNFKVPDHQRDYAWPIDAVEQFLEDIETALTNNESDYFIGLIVLVEPTEGDDSWKILDGQQRLATATMVYSAIRSWLKENGFDRDALKIQERYIGISELGEEHDRPRITLNVKDRETFESLVVNQVSEAYLEEAREKLPKNSSMKKLVEASITCRKFVAKTAKAASEQKHIQASQLFKLADYLRDNVRLAFMDVNSSGNAYIIFESLNDRGIDLSVLDLVKNYIFGKAGVDLEKVQYNWIKMTSTLGDRKADDFLKVFWTSRYGRVQRGTLFDKIKTKYPAKENAIQLSQELTEAIEYYVALDSYDSDVWSDHSEQSRQYMATLNLLAGTQVRPIVLAALYKFPPEKVERLLRWLVTLIVRFQTIGGGRTGRLEQYCTSVAPRVFSGDLKTPQMIWDQLNVIVPKDSDFKNDFAEYSETTAAKARYILSQLEQIRWKELNPGKEMGKIPIHDPNILVLEHILPKNPSDDWKDVLTDKNILQDCLSNIGNLCLLNKKENKKVGSKGFMQKASTIYKESDLILTSDLAAYYSNWDRSTIEQRSKQLTELAVKAWPIT